MTTQHQISFTEYLDEFNQLLQTCCDINLYDWIIEEVAACYQNGLTVEECLDSVDERCGLSELHLKLEE